MSDVSNKNKQYVCLDFGGANCTYIETEEDHFDEEDDLNSWFAGKWISEDNAIDWAARHLSVIFDGILDDPEKFKSIKAIGIYGPSSPHVFAMTLEPPKEFLKSRGQNFTVGAIE